MPCDTRLKPRQTISQRKEEVRRTIDTLSRKLAAGQVKVKISPQGAVAFDGLTEQERDGVTDNCAYRLIMSQGSTQAKLAIQKAEMMAGRTISRQTVAQGGHSHDGGHSWHGGHKGHS
jgi:uncharacterized protein YegL